MGRHEVRVRGEVWILLSLWLLLVPLPWVGAVFLAAAIHELGHLAALWACGIPVWGIEVGCRGAQIRTAPMEPRTELICALAGPVAGMLVCLFWRWFPRTAAAAMIQSGFNLLPFYPMDGGRAWKAVRNICCKSR